MKRILSIALLLLLTACGAADPGAGREPGYQQFHGQWVFINYWAKWCSPCIKEIPELNELNAAFADVQVLGVNYDGVSGEELAQQLSTLGVDFPTLTQDPAHSLGIARPTVLPTTLIINPEGKLEKTLVGPQTVVTLRAAIGL